MKNSVQRQAVDDLMRRLQELYEAMDPKAASGVDSLADFRADLAVILDDFTVALEEMDEDGDGR